MNSMIEILRGRRWKSVMPVPAVPADTIAPKEPRQEYIDQYCLGSYRPSSGVGTPGTPAVPALEVGSDAPAIPLVASWPPALPRLVLDLETYYTADYNLRKKNLVAYVFDPRFHAHGMAIRFPDGRCEFALDIPAAIKRLQQAYGQCLEGAVVVFHHGYFDYLVLHRRYGLQITHIIDTMLLARLVHGPDALVSLASLAAHYGLPAKGGLEFAEGVRHPDSAQLASLRAYATNDVSITSQLADILIPQAKALPLEFWAMDHSIKQFVERPLLVNTTVVQHAMYSLRQIVATQLAATGHSEEELRGTIRFTELLSTALGKSGRKIPTKQGKKGLILAISKKDPAREELLADPDPAVRCLMAARLALSSSGDAHGRLEYLAETASAMAGLCPFLHSYHKSRTGRFSGGAGFNIQNLKKPGPGVVNSEIAANIRRAITAPPGHVFVTADASQIEARVLAFVAGQDDLHHAFASGTDVYSEFASQQFGFPVHKARTDDTSALAGRMTALRQIGKQAVLGLGYGLGVRGFIDALKAKPQTAPLFLGGTLTTEKCAHIVHGYRDQYPRIPEFWQRCAFAAHQVLCGSTYTFAGLSFTREADSLYIAVPSGRRLVYPKIRKDVPSYESRSYIDRHGNPASFIDDKSRILFGTADRIDGRRLAENIIQAVARDILVWVMFQVELRGHRVVLHCHDSITAAVPKELAGKCAEDLEWAWKTVPSWITGLALHAEVEQGHEI